MPYKANADDHPTYTELTEKLRKGYLRFRPDYVPDVICFLTTAGLKFWKQWQGVRASAVSKTSPYFVAMQERNRVAQQVIAELIDMAAGKWDRADWNESYATIERYVGEMVAAGNTAGIREGAILTSQTREA